MTEEGNSLTFVRCSRSASDSVPNPVFLGHPDPDPKNGTVYATLELLEIPEVVQQVPVLAELLDQIERRLLYTHPEHLHHVGMVQFLHDLCLLEEGFPLPLVVVAPALVTQRLCRYRSLPR